MIIEGKVWKFGDCINTELMMPVSHVLLQPGISDAEAAQYCMNVNRPGWAQKVKKGDIIIAGRNWGCGSSRPAARLLKALGIGVIVADSMSRLFFRNAVNIGLPVLMCTEVSGAFSEGDVARVNVETGEVYNVTRKTKLQGEALPAGSPPAQILKSGGLHIFMRQELDEKEPSAISGK
ncbi:3-isopropylmalate dehydratase [Chloroflexota bacterium]